MLHWAEYILLISVGIQTWGFLWLIRYQSDPTNTDWLGWRWDFVEYKLHNKKYKKKHGIDTGDCWSPDELEKIRGVHMIEMNLIEKPVEGIPTVYKKELPVLFYRHWYGRRRRSIQLVVIGLILQIAQIILIIHFS